MGGLFIALALVCVAYWFFRSPMCGAMSDSMRAQYGAEGIAGAGTVERLEESVERLTEELTALRGDVVDLAERVDFSERMLVELRERHALPASRG